MIHDNNMINLAQELRKYALKWFRMTCDRAIWSSECKDNLAILAFGQCLPGVLMCAAIGRYRIKTCYEYYQARAAFYEPDCPAWMSEWKAAARSDKKAVLSQRWPRNAPNRPTWVPWKFSGLPDYAHGYYSQHFSWAFVRIDPMNVPTKFEVRSLTRSWDNRGYPKNLGTPRIRPRSLFSEILISFYSDCPCSRGYPPKLGSLWIRPRSIFSKIFNGLLFRLAI